MSRPLFTRPSQGYREPRGELIRRVQGSLVAGGWNPGPVDGVYGPFTSDALCAFQAAAGLPVDGCITAAVWSSLLRERAPLLADRCLQLTADLDARDLGAIGYACIRAGLDELQNASLRRVVRYWNIAVEDARRFSLNTELGIALCFDIAVRDGGIGEGSEAHRIATWLAAHPSESERGRRLCIADAMADRGGVSDRAEVAQTRRHLLALGDGSVSGARYRSRDWGIGDAVWAD